MYLYLKTCFIANHQTHLSGFEKIQFHVNSVRWLEPAQCIALCSMPKQRRSESLEGPWDTLNSVLSYAKLSCSATTERWLNIVSKWLKGASDADTQPWTLSLLLSTINRLPIVLPEMIAVNGPGEEEKVETNHVFHSWYLFCLLSPVYWDCLRLYHIFYLSAKYLQLQNDTKCGLESDRGDKLGIVLLVELPMSFDTSLLCWWLITTNLYDTTVNGVNSLWYLV